MSCGLKDEQGNDVCLKIERRHKHKHQDNDPGESGQTPVILIGGDLE